MLRHSMSTLAGVILALLLALWSPGIANAAPPLEARTSDAGGVKIVVTPRPLVAGSSVWEFDIVLDTHSKPLTEDLGRLSAIVDEDGRRYAPVSWQADPPGSHHRKGVLQFPLPASPPKTIELQINGVGGVGMRAFKWNLQ